MQYVYGPIPSRRLGRSLGVDPIPLKTCNWNCIYCQLGRSTPLTNERREYIPREAILAEIQETLAHHSSEIDYISFVGSGEPTLHSGLGWLIRAVKAITTIPVAVITNGVLLHRADVRQELLAADVVMPTVSAGTAELYRRIHRPHPDAGFEQLIDGLCAFRAEYTGQLWVEVMLIRNVNDSEIALRDLERVLRRIQPDQVHIVLPDRPPAEPWVQPADSEGLLRAEALLGPVAHIVHPFSNGVHASDYASPDEAIVSIVTRHPMSLAQLITTLNAWTDDEVSDALARLEQAGAIRPVERLGVRFWAAATSVFPT
ncbi:MAG: radical SAM protein [Chloroflexota bacterium]|jgi:wyosine [tRNA(Phe)-imidazoG37] synthetase (radical SAM superfamily)|nr:radical SAM protein [Caldilinea sp.]GIK72857.1 MAG: radical SAM protein [Chloroflexota bacterium]